jgi:hypothetical protein
MELFVCINKNHASEMLIVYFCKLISAIYQFISIIFNEHLLHIEKSIQGTLKDMASFPCFQRAYIGNGRNT